MFVDALGVSVYEGYGLTETSPVVSANVPGQRKFGSVGKPLPGVAPVAMQEGTWAARQIKADLAGKAREPFHYFDKGSLATIGRAAAVALFGKIHISGFIAWLSWLFVHILFLIGFRNRIVVMTEWAWAYFTHQRRVRLITGEKTA